MTDEDDTETAEEAEANAKWQQLGEMVERNLIKFAKRMIDEKGLEPWIFMVAMLNCITHIGGRHFSARETELLFRSSADDLEKFIRERQH